MADGESVSNTVLTFAEEHEIPIAWARKAMEADTAAEAQRWIVAGQAAEQRAQLDDTWHGFEPNFY